MKRVDVLVVGMGLAGALLTRALQQQGMHVQVFDPSPGHSATRIAAGVVNPVTGRRLVKVNRVEEFLPAAVHTWRGLEAELGCTLWEPMPIVWALSDVKAENDWLARCGDPAYAPWIRERVPPQWLPHWVAPARHFGYTVGGGRVRLSVFLDAFAQKLQREGCWTAEPFVYEALQVRANGVCYKEWQAAHVVYCEGIGVRHNPFFRHLPLRAVKGEILLVRIGLSLPSLMLKRKVMLVPLREIGLLWVGATFVNDCAQAQPTVEGRRYLEARMHELLQLPFEVVDQRAGVRPITTDRRPVLVRHQIYPRLWAFNGLASRGALTGPLWAEEMARYLMKGWQV